MTPILFTPDEAREFVKDKARKITLRRPVEPSPGRDLILCASGDKAFNQACAFDSPFGPVGGEWFGQEDWCVGSIYEGMPADKIHPGAGVRYDADGPSRGCYHLPAEDMLPCFSRLGGHVESVTVERNGDGWDRVARLEDRRCPRCQGEPNRGDGCHACDLEGTRVTYDRVQALLAACEKDQLEGRPCECPWDCGNEHGHKCSTCAPEWEHCKRCHGRGGWMRFPEPRGDFDIVPYDDWDPEPEGKWIDCPDCGGECGHRRCSECGADMHRENSYVN